jgi:AcrR family transcriptional regulator
MGQSELTRQRLARAALELFTTRGYHLTTTPLIAKKTGVAEGTIYRHFTSKQALLNEVFRGAARWAHQAIGSAATGAPQERLTAVARAFIDAAARDAGVMRVLFLIPHGDLLDDRSRAADRAVRAAIEGIIAQGKAEGGVRPGSVDVWGGVWLSIVALALARVADKTWRPDDATVHAVIESAWRAIAT